MLIEFKVENYRSFRDEQTLSLVSSNDPTHPDNLISCDGFSVTKTAAVYGPNASGKSNLIKAFLAFRDFILGSATRMTLGDTIDISPFRLDEKTGRTPSQFQITLMLNGQTYIYGFSTTPERVHDEWLYVRKARGRLSNWLERRFIPKTKKTEWKIKGHIKPDAKLLQSKTRENGLVLSRGAELNVKELAPLFLWLKSNLQVFDLSSTPEEIFAITEEAMTKDDSLRSRILDMVKDADFGISNVEVVETQIPLSPWRPVENFGKGKSPNDSAKKESPGKLKAPSDWTISEEKMADSNWSRIFSSLPNPRPTINVISTEHIQYPSGESVKFNLEEDESNGTQRFFALAGPILNAFDNGSTLVIDELDCSMHPLLTRKIIEMFHSNETNPKGAQLIFATHDSSIMDSSLFRRDQIWLTEKRRDGSTDLFSLHDIETRPRNTEAFEKNYLAGRYGAVPKFGPALEDLEIK